VATIGLWSRKPLQIVQLKKEIGLLRGFVSQAAYDLRDAGTRRNRASSFWALDGG
jgi:hypothetical protein